MHDLVVDNAQLNNDNNILEEMEKRKNKFLNLYQKNNFEKINKDDKNSFEQITKEFNMKLMSLYGLHSSKFHSKNDEDSKKINDIINSEIKTLKKENITKDKSYRKILNNSHLSSRTNSKDMNMIRKKLAFRYRFLKNSTKNRGLQNSFRSKNKKMNKILQISKSIPDILLHEIKSINNNKNFNNSYYNNKKVEEDNSLQNYKVIKDYGFLSPFKGNRYIGNMYNYYKSNNCLKMEKLIFPQNNYNNNNIISEKINKINEEEYLSPPNNNKNNGINGELNTKIIKKNEKSGMIQLSSLL